MSPLPGVVFSVCAALVLAGSVVFAPDALPRLGLCTFHTLTGLPCPGCGLTRSFCAISHGMFGAAWAYNPFGLVLYAAAVAFVLRPFAFWSWPVYGRWEERLVRSRWFSAAPLVLVAALIVFGVARILLNF